MPRRLPRAAAGVLIGLVLGAATARADVEPSLRGPRSVVPGSTVRFQAHGFHSGSMVAVVLTPADHAACCAIRLAASFPISPNGAATLEFRMPRYYRNCPPWRKCRKIPWTAGERVIVSAFGYLQQATTATLIAR